MKTSRLYLLLLSFLILSQPISAQKFEVSFSPELSKSNFTGNVLLYLSKNHKNPKDIFVGAELIPVYRIKVTNIKPGQKIIFDDKAISYPVEISNIERGEYFIQAVFDNNLGSANIGYGEGNWYSQSLKVNLSKEFDKTFALNCANIVEDLKFNGDQFYQEVKVKSKLLSDFHKKNITVNGAVKLPKEYFDNPKDKYPVVFTVFGLGGDYRYPLQGDEITHLNTQPVITVFLDGSCPEGHSVYANSDVNGPWGDALINEFIPYLNKKYRTNGANLITGHSSGGWASLWLQINYPETFIGCWASSPDQVDFRNYQNKNIYEMENIYWDKKGNLLADFTVAGIFPVIMSKDFYRTENVIYSGGQTHSFDAVFGGYDTNGNRIRLVNTTNGAINKDALPYWKRYDISLLLKTNWNKYKDAIKGKIMISVGSQDNFHLNKSVILLEKEMTKLNADIKFKYVAGDHFTVYFDKNYQKEGQQFLVKCYDNWLKKGK